MSLRRKDYVQVKPGWVIRDEVGIISKKTGERIVHVSWWYGPRHSWGRTWGAPDLAQTWPTRKAAEAAIAAEYGMGWRFQPKRDTRMKAQKHSDAVSEWEARMIAYTGRQPQAMPK